MNKRKLQIEQLDRKLGAFKATRNHATPPIGWLKTIRLSLGVSLQQMANKLSITKQSAQEIEVREKEGSITLKSLREAANALDLELVYVLLPKDGSIDNLIDRKAKELATQIVTRTSHTMKLEDQENTKERLQKAIEERATALKNETPKALWD